MAEFWSAFEDFGGLGARFLKLGGAPGPVNTVAPAITGDAERGEVLSCSTGTWEGTGSISYAYQWTRNGANIASATANAYTLVEADDNALISCRVTATDDEGSRSRNAAAVGPVLGAPFNLVLPAITGTVEIGETLTCSEGTWQGQATITYGYVWRADEVAIDGATSSTFEITADEYDADIDCVVTATNGLASTPATAAAVGPVPGIAPSIDGLPTIAGTETVGSTLTATAATTAGVPTPSRTWQWTRDGVDIGSATANTYELVEADEGALIRVRQIETNALGNANATSDPTGAIAGGSLLDQVLAIGPYAIYVPAPANMAQNSDGTTAVTTADDPVGRLNDLSGNGRHLIQASSELRWAYKTGSGLHWIASDIGDLLETSAEFDGWTAPLTIASVHSSPVNSGGSSSGLPMFGVNVTAGAGAVNASVFVLRPNSATSSTHSFRSRVGSGTSFNCGISGYNKTVLSAVIGRLNSDSSMDTFLNGSAATNVAAPDTFGTFDGQKIGLMADDQTVNFYGGAIFRKELSSSEVATVTAWLKSLGDIA